MVEAVGEFFQVPGSALSFAHRGGSHLWPENTLGAFRGAWQLGCTHIETDVRMTRDGELVLFHDEGVERTTEGRGKVRDMSLAELRALDAGARFRGQGGESATGAGQRVPTFEELVRALPEARFNVELKEWGPVGRNLPEAVWHFVEHHQLHARILIAAERHELIHHFRRVSRGAVPTSASKRECVEFLLSSWLGGTSLLRLPYCALQIPVRLGVLPVVTSRLVGAAHRRGLAVHVWTVDEEAEMQRLVELGVDGIMSDRPDRLVRVVGGRAPASGGSGAGAGGSVG